MSTPASTRGFQPLRDLPTVFWLVLLVVVALAHRDVPAPPWLMLHLLFLGAVTHAILVWSQYFSFALLRTKQTRRDRAGQTCRLAMSNCGAVLVLVGVPSGIWALTLLGALSLIAAVVWHPRASAMRVRRSDPHARRHGCGASSATA